MFIPKKRGKRVVRKRTYRKKPARQVSASVKKYVKRVIHSQVENKVQNVSASNAFGNINNDPALGMYPMCPYTGLWSIGQGVTQNTRVGNKIKVRRVTLNYTIRPNPYNVTTNAIPQPCEVELYLGRLKQASGILPTNLDVAQLYQLGNSALAPQGNLLDLISDINTDFWTIKKRWRHKVGYADYTGSGPNVVTQYYSNNDFKLNIVKKMDITKFCPKTITFNDSTNSPMGDNLFFFFQAVASQGDTFAAVQEPMRIDYWVSFTYEDA